MNSSLNTDSNQPKIHGVPTNIITGFLGVGKTSAILHLLEHKPRDERWAVLVNEFGEIGVDGSLFNGLHSEAGGVFIREVPGGCMCCAAGLPMQIALNQLLTRAKPDRLLIEPTGLGHPIEVLNELSASHYQNVLTIQKILTLVDARKLSDARYREHATFNNQIAIADIVIGNKQDLYGPADKTQLEKYIKEKGFNTAKIVFTQQGAIDPAYLEGRTAANPDTGHHHHNHNYDSMDTSLASDSTLPVGGYLSAINGGEGFESVGWRFKASLVFDRNRLYSFLNSLSAERMKAVCITNSGVLGYNLVNSTLTEIELDDCMESRIEIIATQIDKQWETQLLECLTTPVSL